MLVVAAFVTTFISLAKCKSQAIVIIEQVVRANGFMHNLNRYQNIVVLPLLKVLRAAIFYFTFIFITDATLCAASNAEVEDNTSHTPTSNLIISADRASIMHKQHKVLLKGHVQIKSSGVTIQSDTVTATYNSTNTSLFSLQDAKVITAIGNVLLKTSDISAISKKLKCFPQEKMLFLEGNVVIAQNKPGGTKIEGEFVNYNMLTGDVSISGGPNAQERVRATIATKDSST